MNQLFSQTTPLETPGLIDGASGPSSSTLRSFPAASPRRAFFRLDLSRALQLHRSLVLGIVLVGLALGAAYFLKFQPVSSTPHPLVKVVPAVAGQVAQASSQDKPQDAQWSTMVADERERLQQELTADRTEQGALSKQLSAMAVPSPLVANASPYGYDFNIGRIRAELVKARADHDQAVTRITSSDASHVPSSAALDAAVADLIATDTGLWGMKLTLTQRRTMVTWKLANFPPTYPARKQDEAELAQLNGALDSMNNDMRAKAATRIEQRLRADLERTAGTEAQLNSQLGQQTEGVGNFTSKQLRASELTADIARLQNLYNAVDKQWRKLTIEQVAPVSEGSQVTAAAAPQHSDSSNVLRNAALIVLAGLLFGLLAAVVAHKMDPEVYSAADVDLAAAGLVLNRVEPQKADPSFRHSVLPVEEYISEHGGSIPSRPVKSGPIAVEAPSSKTQIFEPTPAKSKAEPKAPEPAVVIRQASPAVPDRTAAPAELTLVPPSVSTVFHDENENEPESASSIEPAKPFALPLFAAPPVVPAVQFTQPVSAPPSVEQARLFAPPVSALPAVVPSAQFSQPAALPPSVEPAKPFIQPAFAPPPAASAAKIREPQPTASRLEVLAPNDQSRAIAANSLQRALNMGEPVKPTVATEEIREPDLDDSGPDSGSRVSGLRGLLFGRGGKIPQKAPEPSGETVDFLKQLDRALEQPINPQSGKSALDIGNSARRIGASVSTEWVTAKPEFLPPRPMVETRDSERKGESGSATDEVELGSSWRGQFQRKA